MCVPYDNTIILPQLQEYHSDTAAEVSIATRLKRQKLQEIFPDIDTATLEEIFQSNG